MTTKEWNSTDNLLNFLDGYDIRYKISEIEKGTAIFIKGDDKNQVEHYLSESKIKCKTEYRTSHNWFMILFEQRRIYNESRNED